MPWWKLLRPRVEERLPEPYLTHEAWLGDLRFMSKSA